MSILIVEVVSEGILMAADRNITHTAEGGATSQPEAQDKVVRWPREDVVLGYVGAASLGGMSVPEWLEARRADFSQTATLEEVARNLASQIERQRATDRGSGTTQPMIVHLAGFESVRGHWIPAIWHIRNTHKLGAYGYLDVRKTYEVSEAFQTQFAEVDPSEVRDRLRVLAKQFTPFWIHQGIDLATFNALGGAVRNSFKLLCEQHPKHDIPHTLSEWSKHAKMQVLMYSAYFDAFNDPGGQFVGGGADVLALDWPEGSAV